MEQDNSDYTEDYLDNFNIDLSAEELAQFYIENFNNHELERRYIENFNINQIEVCQRQVFFFIKCTYNLIFISECGTINFC